MKLGILGFGYSAQALAQRALAAGIPVTGSRRALSPEDKEKYPPSIQLFAWAAGQPLPESFLAETSHLLLSVPPDEAGDPVFLNHAAEIIGMPRLSWLGYLSATSVYGDAAGAWVDESTPLEPHDARGERRLRAEKQWLSLKEEKNLPVHLFRLAGIYGPGRNPLVDLMEGTARRLYKPDQVFSRIHVADIAAVLWRSMARPAPGEAYNLADDMPAPSHEVVEFAAKLLGMTPPPLVPIEQAELTPKQASFYASSRKVSNKKLKAALGLTLAYPDYRVGLESIFTEGKQAQELHF